MIEIWFLILNITYIIIEYKTQPSTLRWWWSVSFKSGSGAKWIISSFAVFM